MYGVRQLNRAGNCLGRSEFGSRAAAEEHINVVQASNRATWPQGSGHYHYQLAELVWRRDADGREWLEAMPLADYPHC